MRQGPCRRSSTSLVRGRGSEGAGTGRGGEGVGIGASPSCLEKQRWSTVAKTLQEYTTPAAGAKASGRMSLAESSYPLPAWCRGAPTLGVFIPRSPRGCRVAIAAFCATTRLCVCLLLVSEEELKVNASVSYGYPFCC